MVSVSRALQRIKQDLDPHLPPAAIEAACRAAGHAWRERKLGPVATVHLMVVQMLHLNAPTRALRHVAGAAVSAAAYCEARARLPVAAVQALLRDAAASLRAALSAGGGGGGGGTADPTLWRGHRTLLVDGSGTLAPDTPDNRRAFPLNRNQRPGCSLPVPRVLGLFDAVTGLVAELLAFDLFAHEQAKVPRLHPLLRPGDLLVGDRGFCSFAHLAALWAAGVLACFRLHQSQIVDFRPRRRHYDRRRGGARRQKAQRGRPRSKWVRRLGRHDQVVRWTKPKAKDGGRCLSRAAFDALPDELEVREVRYRVGERGYRTREVTVVTTLLDPVAGRAELPRAQGDDGHGPAEVPDEGRRAEGAGRVLPGVQPRAGRDRAGRGPAGHDARPRQLRRRAAVAGGRGGGGGRRAGAGRQPAAARAVRAARGQGPARRRVPEADPAAAQVQAGEAGCVQAA